ncbi:MAG: hypothetical protein ACRD2C_24070 [Acidimicrobiales bacterium]
MMHRTGRALLLGALLLTFAACGDDDDSDEADGADEATEETSDEADAVEDDTADSEDESAGEGDDSTLPTIDPSGLDGFCRDAVEARNTIVGLQASTMADPTSAPEAYASAHDALAAVDAPDVVAADWAAITDLIGTAADILATIDVTDQAAIDEAFGSPEMQARGAEAAEASDRVDTHLTDECDIDLGDTGG